MTAIKIFTFGFICLNLVLLFLWMLKHLAKFIKSKHDINSSEKQSNKLSRKLGTSMDNKKSKEIFHLIERKSYEQAYMVGKTALGLDPNNKEILEALHSLEDKLRGEAMLFSSKKANYSAISEQEKLLKKVNVLTGRDVYGI